MRFPLLFAERPILALSLNCIIVIVGLVAFRHIELRHVPLTSVPEIQIGTILQGANNQIIESKVTKPIEESLVALEGIKNISSDSEDGWSRVFVKGKLGANSQLISQIRDRITSILPTLPAAVKHPFIWESGEDSKAIIGIAFQDTYRSQTAVSDYIRRMVYDQLALLEGVGEIRSYGHHVHQVEIQLDPGKMATRQLTVDTVLAALRKEKFLASGGEFETVQGQQPVILATTVTRPEEIANWTLHIQNDVSIKLRDIADIKISDVLPEYKIQIEGKEAVGLDIIPKPLANPIEVAINVKKFIQSLQKILPQTMKAFIFYDMTSPFDAALKAVKTTFYEALILVGIIIWIGLSSWRGALISMITVPICLIGSFILMWLLHFSFNPMTLLALVLAIGLVVDDAIVVIENVHTHQTSAQISALAAIKKSMKEISFAVFVMTVTLAAVYLPIGFQNDESMLVFKEFAWTLAGTVLFSGIVALTLIPALCAKFLNVQHPITPISKKIKSVSEFFWINIEYHYHKKLESALTEKKRLIILMIIICALGIFSFVKLPSEFMPTEDEDILQGYIEQTTNKVLPSLQDEWKKSILELTEKIPERLQLVMYQWKNSAWWNLSLKPSIDRKRNAQEISEALQKELAMIVGPSMGVDVFSSNPSKNSEVIKIILQYNGDYHDLLQSAHNIMTELTDTKQFERVWSKDTMQTARLQFLIDQPLASLVGVSMETIEDTVSTLLSGKKVMDFPFQGLDYEVMLRSNVTFRQELENINNFFVVGAAGQWVPLGSIMHMKEILEPTRLKRYNRLRAVTVHVSLKPHCSLERAIALVEAVISKHLPEGGRYQWSGQLEKYQEAKRSMTLTFGLALLFIFFVLAALFESFIDPLIILLTVPLSLGGALIMVYVMGGSSNIYTYIGLITLIGLITKHGILITDFANRLQKKGCSLKEAALQAAISRLRPVLMTTFAMVGSAIPLMFGVGAGAMARHHIGWVIVGGMISGTFFSLFIIPLVYLTIGRLKKSYQ